MGGCGCGWVVPDSSGGPCGPGLECLGRSMDNTSGTANLTLLTYLEATEQWSNTQGRDGGNSKVPNRQGTEGSPLMNHPQ
ncbi:hypothetical protein E2C01_097918 [Portunus trituberculatus]|uniref:Uncharacterized protein n=1 Tax=Portunus trituberculatus TaxID=210409 RepID=A0A5B7JWF5_PORTR|nr:hypothetical protein [Portunus trituberculatus]